jgi:hypothetical protein
VQPLPSSSSELRRLLGDLALLLGHHFGWRVVEFGEAQVLIEEAVSKSAADWRDLDESRAVVR